MEILLNFVRAAGIAVFLFGLQSVLLAPFTLVYELWKKRFLRRHSEPFAPMVSVIIPAYNEETTIVDSVDSVLASEYPNFEVIVVNDGSTDKTGRLIDPFAEAGSIIAVHQRNGGKASALNAGVFHARGEIIVYTDADSVFLPNTLASMVRWFADPGMDAVCGNDMPIHPGNPLQKLLAVTTHIGTGFVRRAFSILGIMPVISGNLGAVRKETLDAVGGFSRVWGEDLDLTFKLHRIRARIVYDSEALVLCDVPSTFRALWRQRVRWVRSYLKIVRMHRDMVLNPRYAPFSWYLPVNWFSMIGIPVFQVLTAAILPFLVYTGRYRVEGPLDIISFMGFGMFLAVAVYSILLDREPRHLLHLIIYGWMIVPVSYFYDAVVLYSWYCELLGRSERWMKIDRRDLRAIPVAGFNAARTAPALGISLAAVVVIAVVVVAHLPGSVVSAEPPAAGRAQLTVATHFDAWENPDDAVGSLLKRDRLSVMTTVAVEAGRLEWNFFRWGGHEETWSNDQRMHHSDLLGDAVTNVGRDGRRVVAIVDFYAPNYVLGRPGVAAHDVDGSSSPEQVCFTELVSGDYGRRLTEMITYIARSYDVEGISLTELAYNRFCYDDRCLASFKAESGSADWPRTLITGAIDRDREAIGAWRSKLMAQFLHQIADSVHQYGKKLYVDVPFEDEHREDEGLRWGLQYPALLKFADGLVVWDYFYLEGRPPESSEGVARYFVSRYGTDRITISIGLWGSSVPVSPSELSAAITAARRGGAERLWITPNHLLTAAHWRALVGALSAPKTLQSSDERKRMRKFPETQSVVVAGMLRNERTEKKNPSPTATKQRRRPVAYTVMPSGSAISGSPLRSQFQS